jgi:transcriptional regulator with XRE-family HTH domain
MDYTARMAKQDLLALFRANLTSLRESAGLTQAELGRLSKTSASYICDLERGRRAPNLATLIPVAKALGIHPSKLIAEKL